MNKKVKLLASALCGVLLSSSLAFTSVQAATVKDNVQTNISKLSARPYNSLSPALSKDGVLYWYPVHDATSYKYQVYNQTYPYTGQKVTSADTSSCHSILYDSYSSWHANCTYKVELRSEDRGNVISTATLYFYYDGTNFIQQ